MRDRFNAMIDNEMANAKAGKPAANLAKINSMEDREVTERLYAASQAGVQIDLIVRSFCCLRPAFAGFPRTSAWCRSSGGSSSTAACSTSPTARRTRCTASGTSARPTGCTGTSPTAWSAVPIRDYDARRRLLRVIEVMMSDHRHAWDLDAAGHYTPRTPLEDAGVNTPGNPWAPSQRFMKDATGG